MKATNRILPRRIILVRHGESQGNLSSSAYCSMPDHQIPLTPVGIHQAQTAGEQIHNIISSTAGDSSPGNGNDVPGMIYFYVSPYERTRLTLSEIGRSFRRSEIAGAREECRIREQDFGNFQVVERMKVVKETRERYGRFFFRFPEGESAADVYDRVTSFLESLWRDIDMNRINRDAIPNFNVVIVSHGIACRIFLMKWFKWTAQQFERLNNLNNCEVRVMQLGQGGDQYSLAVHHTRDELEQWGLSPEMIADQEWRATANRGAWNEDCPYYLNDFFIKLKDEDGRIEQGVETRCDANAGVEEEILLQRNDRL